MFLADRLTLDAPKRTKDGYLAGRARVARTGIYDYAGFEVDPENKHGLRDKAVVKIYRPGDEVFDADSLRSFVGKPITNDHPTEAVTADNWRTHARGTIMGAVRDGEYVGFDYLITDAAMIADIEAGKRELSNGYATDLEFTSGTFNDQAYDAVQRTIRGNHLAVVRCGRAGSECAIKDGAIPVCDAINAEELARLSVLFNQDGGGTMPHTLMIDGLQVPNVSDEAKACIEKLQGQLSDANKALADAKTEHDKVLATKDAEIDDLKTKAIDQDKIDALADAKAAVVADAKKIAGDKLADTKGKTVADVRRMALDAIGVDLKDKSEGYVDARFELEVEKYDGKSIANSTVHNLSAPRATTVADARASVDTIRAARYAY